MCGSGTRFRGLRFCSQPPGRSLQGGWGARWRGEAARTRLPKGRRLGTGACWSREVRPQGPAFKEERLRKKRRLDTRSLGQPWNHPKPGSRGRGGLSTPEGPGGPLMGTHHTPAPGHVLSPAPGWPPESSGLGGEDPSRPWQGTWAGKPHPHPSDRALPLPRPALLSRRDAAACPDKPCQSVDGRARAGEGGEEDDQAEVGRRGRLTLTLQQVTAAGGAPV